MLGWWSRILKEKEPERVRARGPFIEPETAGAREPLRCVWSNEKAFPADLSVQSTFVDHVLLDDAGIGGLCSKNPIFGASAPRLQAETLRARCSEDVHQDKKYMQQQEATKAADGAS